MRLFSTEGLVGYEIIASHPTKAGTMICVIVKRNQLVSVNDDQDAEKETLSTNWSLFHIDNYDEPNHSVIIMADVTNVLKDLGDISENIVRDTQRILGGYGTLLHEDGRFMLANYVLTPIAVDDVTHNSIIAQYIDAMRIKYVKQCMRIAMGVNTD